MTQVLLNKFDGGIAEDIRTHETDQCEESLNFDIFTNPHYLQPYPDTVEDLVVLGGGTSGSTEPEFSEVAGTAYKSGSLFVTYGYEHPTFVDADPQLYFKTNYNDNWIASNYFGTGDMVKGSLVIYKDTPYILENTGGTYGLLKPSAPSTMTAVGTIAEAPTSKGFVHPEDNVLYWGFGSNIVKWDDSAFTTYSSIIPTNLKIVSLTDYGTYLAIACTPKNGYGKSILFLWGRDGTINTLQATIDLGIEEVKIIENLSDTLVIVSISNPYVSLTTNKIIIKVYSGGAVNTIKSIKTNVNSRIINTHRSKQEDRLYFSGIGEDCLYAFGKNKEGYWVVTKDRYLYNGAFVSSIITGLTGFSLIGEILWVGFKSIADVFYLFRTSTTYTSTSVYKTTVNPNMVLYDRYREKQLKSVRVSYTGASSGSTTIKYKVDGGTLTTIQANTNATGEKFFEAYNESDGKAFQTGREFQFQIESSGGAKIKEIAYNYQVIETQPN